MTQADYLAKRQTAGIEAPRAELNVMLEAVVRNFGAAWLEADDDNPVQKVWGRRDALATNELLNFADAVKNLEAIDAKWLRGHVEAIKGKDEGNCYGAIFEILALSLFCAPDVAVEPSGSGNPGYDGTIRLSDGSSLLVSIKNHGMSSYEKDFRKNARELDNQFTAWLKRHKLSGELRVICRDYLGPSDWARLKSDLQNGLDGHLDGSSAGMQTSGAWRIQIQPPDTLYFPLSRQTISSVVFVCSKAHNNEQKKFVEDVRKGCTNLTKHTGHCPDEACRVLLVRLAAGASSRRCVEWAQGYFADFPEEKVGMIFLYQAAVINSKEETSLAHFIEAIPGPQFRSWIKPDGAAPRRFPNITFLIGKIIGQASKKVLQRDTVKIPLDDAYTYQRGDIFRAYQLKDKLDFKLQNPAPGIKIHAEVEKDGEFAIMTMIASEQSELLLLP